MGLLKGQGGSHLEGAAEIGIREVRREDLERILDLEEKSFPSPYPMGYLRFLANKNRSTFLVAEADDRLLGYVIADIRNEREGHIISIAVRPEKRRRGIARLLIRNVDRKLEEAGADRVKLEVRKSNTSAIELYRSLGYETDRLVPGYYRDGEDAIKMTYRMDDG